MGFPLSVDCQARGARIGLELSRCSSFTNEIRKAIYTTNAIESLNMSLRKITKTRGSFPSEEACLKLLSSGVEKRREKVDNAHSELGISDESICHYV